MKNDNAKDFRITYLFILVLVISSCTANLTSNSPKKIAIQPYGLFDASIADTVKASIEETFSFDVEVLSSIPIPQSAFVNVKSPRYRADSLIRLLKVNKSNKFDHIIGLLKKDISTTKKDLDGTILKPVYKYTDWGIFGLGYRPGASCVVSTFRLKTPDRKIFIERLKKVCNHELGHNLGLPHCESGDKCVMKDAAESIKTVDHVNLVLCDQCQSTIE